MRDIIFFRQKWWGSFTQLETGIIRQAMFLQDGVLFKRPVYMFNIMMVISNIYDYNYRITEKEYMKGTSSKSEWERNLKKIYRSMLRNLYSYKREIGNYDLENTDYPEEGTLNKENPLSNKKRYNEGSFKTPFLDLLFNGNKYGNCFMRKKRKEDCPLYLILLGFFEWIVDNDMIDTDNLIRSGCDTSENVWWKNL